MVGMTDHMKRSPSAEVGDHRSQQGHFRQCIAVPRHCLLYTSDAADE